MSSPKPTSGSAERRKDPAERRVGGLAADIEQRLRAAALSTPVKEEEAAAMQAAARFNARADREGLADIVYATVDSPFGPLTAAATHAGLVRLAFPEEPVDEVLDRLARKLSPRILEEPARFDAVRRELEEYFNGQRRDFDVPLDRVLMSAFALKVLAATSAIPYGKVSTYMQMATAAGSPRGSRAAGNALGSNPIPVIVPCHRVLHSTGGLGGYGGGLDRKRYLLELEGVPLTRGPSFSLFSRGEKREK
jgi:methylated-DNA-[protein]-cysteine S-methyltransferase